MILVPQEIDPNVSEADLKAFVKKKSTHCNTVVIVPSDFRMKFWADVADLVVRALAHSDGADFDTCASKQLASHFIERGAPLFLGDRAQRRRVIGVQRRSAPGAPWSLDLPLHRHPRPPASCLDKNIARYFVFVYTL